MALPFLLGVVCNFQALVTLLDPFLWSFPMLLYTCSFVSIRYQVIFRPLYKSCHEIHDLFNFFGTFLALFKAISDHSYVTKPFCTLWHVFPCNWCNYVIILTLPQTFLWITIILCGGNLTILCVGPYKCSTIVTTLGTFVAIYPFTPCF